MKIQILGALRVEIDGIPVDLGAPKQRALLALLLLNVNQVVATERLIDLIWGDAPPRTADHSVQIYVSALRKTLSEGLIETRAHGYVLHSDPEQLDAVRFQRLVEQGGADNLRTALGLWYGSPLSDFVYDDWAQPHIRRLENLHARAVELLAEAELEDGRAAEVPALLADLIEKEPLREAPRRLLMLALYRSGRQAEALRTFREFRRLVGEEMGVEPSVDLVQLEEQILLQDPSLLPPRVVSAGTGPVARNPYKGLGAFDEIDAADFFGRDKLVAEMADTLAAGSRLLVVVGPSGSGKSSAVRAGLIPGLRDGLVLGSDRWILATMTPGRHPFEQLEAALMRVARSEVPAVLEQLTENDTGFLRVALRLVPDEKAELLLFVDQFEELFTLATERLRRRFLDNLVTAVTDPRSRVRVVVTLRADFYDKPLLSQRFAPVFSSSIVNVVPLSPAELEAATLGPAAAVGVEVQPALLAQLVSDMGEEDAALPLLQYTLTEMFNGRRGGPLTLRNYDEIGGLQGALTARADHLFESFVEPDQEVARRMLLHLVGVERGSKATRRRVSLDDLRQLGEVDEVLASFISNRLLTADRDLLTGKATIQVTHEALLEGWGRLQGWIELHSTDLQRRSTLSTAAAEWEASGRDVDYLLTGGRLTQLEAWSAETALGIAPMEMEFLRASVALREITEGEDVLRQQREAVIARRAKRRLWGLAAALTLFVATATYAILAGLPEPLPEIAFVTEALEGGMQDMIQRGYDRAVGELGIDTKLYLTEVLHSADEVRRLSEGGVRYVLGVPGSVGFGVVEVAPEFPETRYVTFDIESEPEPNVANWVFAEEQGSFLVGAAAALKSETGVIGFVGGVDMPLIHKFQAGFEAGARAVRPDIEILVEYLSPAWEWSGFISSTLAQLKTEPMYTEGADVIYHAAGEAGLGVFEAAVVESERMGRHLWAIGVDSDQYNSVLDRSYIDFGGPDPITWQPHILTSMLKRFDVGIYTVLQELAQDLFTPGPRVLGIVDGGVDYSTSGGFIDDIIPALEDLKARIISGEIVVPEVVGP